MAYGTDKHPDSEEFKKEAWPDEHQEPVDTLGLSDRLARLEQRGLRSADLSTLRADLDALEARLNAKEMR
jgi:hypothetical protein